MGDVVLMAYRRAIREFPAEPGTTDLPKGKMRACVPDIEYQCSKISSQAVQNDRRAGSAQHSGIYKVRPSGSTTHRKQLDHCRAADASEEIAAWSGISQDNQRTSTLLRTDRPVRIDTVHRVFVVNSVHAPAADRCHSRTTEKDGFEQSGSLQSVTIRAFAAAERWFLELPLPKRLTALPPTHCSCQR